MSLKEALASKQEEKPKTAVYRGEYRILNTNASPIEKVEGVYKPKNADEVACLEYQVKMGRISKEEK
jgi:hypothetical protein